MKLETNPYESPKGFGRRWIRLKGDQIAIRRTVCLFAGLFLLLLLLVTLIPLALVSLFAGP